MTTEAPTAADLYDEDGTGEVESTKGKDDKDWKDVKRTPEYVVLKMHEVGNYHVVDTVKAANDVKAIQAIGADQGSYIAVPVRMFRMREVKVETKTELVVS